MTVHAPDTRNTPASNHRGPRSWSITRVAAGSVAAGTAAALVLTMAVFPGATEAVVTGSLLVGFGLGWGALAFVSERKTSQPQRWARVPAVAMTATGVGLMVCSPQNAALTVLNWVWPPLLLGLVAWMYARSRRAIPGRTRWLLIPAFAVLALASLGAGVQNVTSAGLTRDHPAPGKTYSVRDHRLHIDCHGTGGPTVVLFDGMGEFSGSWARITEQGADSPSCPHWPGSGWVR